MPSEVEAVARWTMIAPGESKPRVGKLIRAAKKLAREYRAVTGRPLGVTGEFRGVRRRK